MKLSSVIAINNNLPLNKANNEKEDKKTNKDSRNDFAEMLAGQKNVSDNTPPEKKHEPKKEKKITMTADALKPIQSMEKTQANDKYNFSKARKAYDEQ